MRLNRIFLAATLLPALGVAGCDHVRSLTEPPSPASLAGPYTFSMSTTLSNTSGTPTIVDAEVLIDNNVEADSCPPGDRELDTDPDGNVISFSCTAPAVAAVTLSTGGHIGPGMHTMLFFISSQTAGSSPTPYTVMAFTFQVSGANGNLIKSISLPSQSANLAIGQSIVYTFTL
jgi:hypothetical protein